MEEIKQYKFQFNNDEASCYALASLIKDGWKWGHYQIEDGYTWFILTKD